MDISNSRDKKLPILTLSSATNAASVPPEGNDLGLVLDVLEEGKGALQLHAVDGLSGLTGVLEADTQVRAPGAGALCGRNVLSSVTDLMQTKTQHQRKPCPIPNSSTTHITERKRWRWYDSNCRNFFFHEEATARTHAGKSRTSPVQQETF